MELARAVNPITAPNLKAIKSLGSCGFQKRRHKLRGQWQFWYGQASIDDIMLTLDGDYSLPRPHSTGMAGRSNILGSALVDRRSRTGRTGPLEGGAGGSDATAQKRKLQTEMEALQTKWMK